MLVFKLHLSGISLSLYVIPLSWEQVTNTRFFYQEVLVENIQEKRNGSEEELDDW